MKESEAFGAEKISLRFRIENRRFFAICQIIPEVIHEADPNGAPHRNVSGLFLYLGPPENMGNLYQHGQ